MRTTSSFSDYQPLGHIGRIPIHITTVICALCVLGMLLGVILGSANAMIPGLVFYTEEFYFKGWIWQPFTSVFLGAPTFFFLMGVMWLYSSGREVERYLGRIQFLKFVVLCLLIVPLTLGAWRLAGVSGVHAGTLDLLIAMFVAFATLYPNMEYFGWVPLKYVAFACFGIACLNYFPNRDWQGLSVLVTEGAFSFGFIRYLQHGGSTEFADFNGFIGFKSLKEKLFGPRRNFRVLPDPPRTEYGYLGSKGSALAAIDPLLEKISKSGLASLTRKERAELEKAREALLKNESMPP